MIKIILLFTLLSLYLQAEWKEAFFKQSYVPISIDCVDSNNCYALLNSISAKDNEETLIYKSYNQGKDWNEIYRYNPLVDNPKFLFSPWCASVPNGNDYFISYFERGTLKVSNDSAKTFRIVDLETPREVLWMDMYDDKIGMAFTPINNYITYDGWETWEKRDDFFKTADTLNKVTFARSPSFLNKDTLYLLNNRTLGETFGSCFTIYDMKTKTSNYYIIDTIYYDGTRENVGPNHYIPSLFDFSFIDINTFIAVGGRYSGIGDTSYNLIYKSTDGGKTWIKKHEQLENITSTRPYAFGLQKVDFYDSKNGVAVGQFGSVALTNDSGDTWIYDELPESMDGSPTMKIEWAGRTPIIGAYKGGLYYYEGDFFKFDPEEQYKITGQVTTEEGEPVEGVKVEYRLQNKPSQTYSVITNSEGNYVINDMSPNSSLQINPKSTFFKIKYEPFVAFYSLTKDTTINFIEITAEKFYNISGKVSEDGEGVKRVPVELQTGYGIKKTFTDDFGNYKFEAVPSDEIRVINGSAGNSNFWYYEPFWHKFNLINDTTGIDFEIVDRDKETCRRVSGKVTLEGEGVPDVEVSTLVYDPHQFENVLTDENGYYITNFLCSNQMEVMLYNVEHEKFSITPDMYNLFYNEYPDGYVNIDFELSPITSVETKDNTPFIYPNPSRETVTISGIDFGRVEIYNSLGQMLIQSEIKGNSSVNTSNLQTGIYLIKIESNKEVKFEKLLINK